MQVGKVPGSLLLDIIHKKIIQIIQRPTKIFSLKNLKKLYKILKNITNFKKPHKVLRIFRKWTKIFTSQKPCRIV